MASVMWGNLLNYLTKLITSFDEYLAIENAAKQTRKNYKSDLTNFFSSLCESQELQRIPSHIDSPENALRPITHESIESFKRRLELTHTPTATINRRLSAIRAFFRFAILNGWIEENPAQYVSNISLAKPDQSNHSVLNVPALPPIHYLPTVHELPPPVLGLDKVAIPIPISQPEPMFAPQTIPTTTTPPPSSTPTQ
ncbi:MAG TPA: site-specific integrase, partial [Patescibacteria group bacterium]|nr:site-specific integrase [Patescibacteria group bacterium]